MTDLNEYLLIEQVADLEAQIAALTLRPFDRLRMRQAQDAAVANRELTFAFNLARETCQKLEAERDGLRALVERVVEIGPLLHAGSIADLIYGKTANTYKLTQLLDDCQEALK